MTYDRWKTREPEPCTEEAYIAGCTCRWSSVHPADVDPPEPVIDHWCPLHGRDPDAAYEDYRERRDNPEPDTADDYRDLEDGDVGSAR